MVLPRPSPKPFSTKEISPIGDLKGVPFDKGKYGGKLVTE